MKKKYIKLNNEITLALSEFFKVFGDDTRLKIIHLLLNQEISVNAIAEMLQMEQSTISHQLRILKQARLVKYRKQGRSVFYELDDAHVKQIFRQGLNHIMEASQ